MTETFGPKIQLNLEASRRFWRRDVAMETHDMVLRPLSMTPTAVGTTTVDTLGCLSRCEVRHISTAPINDSDTALVQRNCHLH
jgi:hypothetical protein